MSEIKTRPIGKALFGVNFEPTGQAPLDARLVVENMETLLANETYVDRGNNFYEGMPVIVKQGKSGKSELWVLIDGTKVTDKAGWRRLDADGASIDVNIEEAIANAINNLNKEDTEEEGKFVTKVAESSGIITVTRQTVAADKVTATAITDGTDTVAVTGANVDAQIKSLAKTVKTVQDNAAKYEVEKVTTDLPVNVEARYQVVSYVGTKTDTNKTKVGEFIDIPKDGQLKNVEVIKNAKDEPTVVKFTYILGDGSVEKVVEVDLGKAIFESEVGSGLQVDSTTGVISVKKDAASETFLTVGADGVKLAGVQTAINNTITTEISKLDSEKTSTDGVKVAVKVTEVDGKISAVNVTETDIASANTLTDEISRAKAAEDKIETSVGLNADGSHKPTAGKYTSQATTIAEEIAALDAKLFEVVNDDVIDCGVYAG